MNGTSFKSLSRMALASACLLSGLAGCTQITEELRHSGGYGGAVMDRHFVDASSGKRAQLLRAAMVIALASKVGLATVHDGNDADAFIKYQQSAVDQLNFLAGDIFGQMDAPAGNVQAVPGTDQAAAVTQKTIPPKLCADLSDETTKDGCDGYPALFEADLPGLEYKTGRLIIAALPQRRAASFIRAAEQGNVFAAGWRALQLAGSSLDGMHRGAAAYRTALELEALVDAYNGGPCAASRAQTVETAVTCLGLEKDSLRHPHGPPRIGRNVPAAAFDVLVGLARASCRELPVGGAQEGSTTEVAMQIRARRDQCAKLVFEPRLRFGGMRESASTSQ